MHQDDKSNRPKINILFVHASDEMYGSDFVLLQLIRNLDTAKFRSLVVLPNDVPYDGRLSRELAKINVPTIHYRMAVIRRKYFKPFSVLLFAWRLICSVFFFLRLIKKERIDIVHSNTTLVLAGALAAKWHRTRNIWHVLEIITKPRFLNSFISWMVPRLSERVVAASQATLDNMCMADPLNRTRGMVIYNGIDPSQFDFDPVAREKIRREWGIREEEVLVGMVGRVHHWKGQDFFLKVAAAVARSAANVRFAIVGGTFPGQEYLLDELKEQARQSGIEGRVIFSEFRTDIPSVLQAYDVFVLPSTSPDPFPTVVLEAMASGKPLVANAHGGSCEMVAHEITGFLITPNVVEEMASAVLKLVNDPALRRSLGEKGRERVGRLFSVESCVRQWVNLYSESFPVSERSSNQPVATR